MLPLRTVNLGDDYQTTKPNYLKKVEAALNHVRRGDVYQVQIGQKITLTSEITPINVYANLRVMNPSPYMYLFSIEGTTIVGASPELFIKIEDGEVLMRPIAGTIGKAFGINKALATEQLHSNKKELAEHLMLIDLCRNDLHRIADSESVVVSDMLEIEEYSHVYHMVTTTRALIKKGKDKYDVLLATFPAGTMTGTPKIRAMEIISDLEDSSRGLYAGCLGLISFGSDFINTALCIRTATFKDGCYCLRASAGIVSDSNPDKELAETMQKMGSMFRAITGRELLCPAA
ncbi:anthranilate synthase component I family protein [Polynucleobacter brandtiae]|uniref:anthranilate synthase component I family protein n=1 Tax=Polynucleobacter brandtiae TaxID=1938816 RepID=UPI000C23F181|nr:anthranilate synthase component I family protein [Polynucleobacter brandtiae]